MKTPGSTSDLEHARVLIVDDVPENLTVLGEVLQSAGCLVQVANSGAAALRLATQVPAPELILLDVMMPGMDGYEVLRRLRADPATRALPVVAISSNARSEDLARGRAAGFADYLTKPLDVARLLALVDALPRD